MEHHLPKGHALYEAGQTGHVWQIQRGLMWLSADQGQALTWLALPGDMLGVETLCGEAYACTAVALKGTTLARLSVDTQWGQFSVVAQGYLQQQQRLRDMAHWLRPLEPIMACVRLLMRLLRDTEVAQKVMTQEGVYQQSLSANKNYQLLRISMQPNMQLVPTVSAHRLMVTIRMMRREGEKMLHAGNVQVGFELALCS